MTEPLSDTDRVVDQMAGVHDGLVRGRLAPIVPDLDAAGVSPDSITVTVRELHWSEDPALAQIVRAVHDSLPPKTWHVHAHRLTGPVTGIPEVLIDTADVHRIIAEIVRLVDHRIA